MPKVYKMSEREADLLARGIHMESTNFNPERDEAPVDVEGVIDLIKYYALVLMTFRGAMSENKKPRNKAVLHGF